MRIACLGAGVRKNTRFLLCSVLLLCAEISGVAWAGSTAAEPRIINDVGVPPYAAGGPESFAGSGPQTVAGGNALPQPNAADSIQSLINALAMFTPETISKIEGAETAANALSTRLGELFPDIGKAQVDARMLAITAAAEKLTVALPKKPPADKAGLKTALLEDEKAFRALTALEKTLGEMELANAGPMIRVIEAKVGDTYPSGPVVAQRWCNATAAMTKLCDRKSNCSLTAAFEVDLCGYNPAPSADPRHRGVFVRYECVRGINANFVRQHPVPGENTNETGLARPRGDYVIIRGGGAIVCSTP
jgi:hypothetical protein